MSVIGRKVVTLFSLSNGILEMKTKKQTTMERNLLLLYASICLTTLMHPVPEQRSLVPLFLASHTVWNKKLEPGRPPAPFVFEAVAVRWAAARRE